MLSRLVLTDFRNHADLTLAPGAGFVVLTGENGAGKTNVIEAVSLLAPGRGLRTAALGEMARQGGKGGFGVAAVLDTTQSPSQKWEGRFRSPPARSPARPSGGSCGFRAPVPPPPRSPSG